MPRRRASSARQIELRNRVVEIVQRPDGTWNVVTEQGHGHSRARRQLRRPVGARGRPHGRPRTAGAGDGAHVSADRGRCPRSMEFNRSTGREMIGVSISRAKSTPARSATASCSAPTKRPASRGRRTTTPGISATNCSPPTSTASRRRWRSASGISPAIEQRRHQADHQRPLHLRARRQSAGRARCRG